MDVYVNDSCNIFSSSDVTVSDAGLFVFIPAALAEQKRKPSWRRFMT